MPRCAAQIALGWPQSFTAAARLAAQGAPADAAAAGAARRPAAWNVRGRRRLRRRLQRRPAPVRLRARRPAQPQLHGHRRPHQSDAARAGAPLAHACGGARSRLGRAGPGARGARPPQAAAPTSRPALQRMRPATPRAAPRGSPRRASRCRPQPLAHPSPPSPTPVPVPPSCTARSLGPRWRCSAPRASPGRSPPWTWGWAWPLRWTQRNCSRRQAQSQTACRDATWQPLRVAGWPAGCPVELPVPLPAGHACRPRQGETTSERASCLAQPLVELKPRAVQAAAGSPTFIGLRPTDPPPAWPGPCCRPASSSGTWCPSKPCPTPRSRCRSACAGPIATGACGSGKGGRPPGCCPAPHRARERAP